MEIRQFSPILPRGGKGLWRRGGSPASHCSRGCGPGVGGAVAGRACGPLSIASAWRLCSSSAIPALPISPSLERSRSLSVLVLAPDGSILRGFLTADGKWRLPVDARSGRPALSPDAGRRRGPALRAASRASTRSPPLRALGPARSARPHRVGRLDTDDADGAPARASPALARRQTRSRWPRRWASNG